MYIFSHPDYTVGFGIAPNQPQSGSQAMTAGQESHPALKIILLYHCDIYLSIPLFNLKTKKAGEVDKNKKSGIITKDFFRNQRKKE